MDKGRKWAVKMILLASLTCGRIAGALPLGIQRGGCGRCPCSDAPSPNERVERTRWPLKNVHGPCPDFTPPFPVCGLFGYQGEPLLIPDVDVLAA